MPVHPGWLRCSPVEQSDQPPFSRRASRAPRRPGWQGYRDHCPWL